VKEHDKAAAVESQKLSQEGPKQKNESEAASIAAYTRGDYKAAADGFTILAEQGESESQSFLGVMYEHGTGVPKDEQQASIWYRKAADQGNPRGQSNLGVMYANGSGVPKDEQQAYFWWLLSSAQGVAESVKNWDIIEQQLTPQQRANAQARARDWKPE